MTGLKAKFQQTYEIFENRSFLFSSWSLACFSMVKALRVTIMGWYIYQETNSPLHLGLIALAEAVPYILANPLSGYLADRIGRKKPVMLLAVMTFFLTLYLSYLVSQPFSNDILYHIYFNFILFGFVRGLLGSGALASMIAFVVPRNHFQKATAWNGIFVKTALIIGPVIGGTVYDLYGITAANNLVLAIMVLVFGLLFFVQDVPITKEDNHLSEWHKLTAGFRFVFTHEALRATLLLDFVALVFSGVVGLLPVFAKDILHTGPDGLGYLKSSLQAGAVMAGIILGHYQIRNFIGKQFIWAEILCSLFLLSFSLSTSFYLSLVFLFMGGFFDYASTVIRHTLMRLLTPHAILGRVTAVRSLFAVTASEASTFESGLVAGAIGAVPSVIFGVSVTMLASAFTWWKAPTLKTIKVEDILQEEQLAKQL